MTEWIRLHAADMWWLAGFSAVAFVATLIVVPALVLRIPADYFTHTSRHRTPWAEHHPVVRGALLIGKNVIGYCVLIAGIAMLVLPGQGLLTIAIGLMLVDFPGKYRLERWFVGRPAVLRSINWLRRRGGHPVLVVESADGSP